MKPSPRGTASLLGLVLCLVAVAGPAAAEAGRAKLDKALRDARRAGTTPRVIIQTRPGSRLALKRALLAHGDSIQGEHPALESLTVTLHGEDLSALEADPRVLSVSIDAEVNAFAAPGGASQKPTHSAPARPAVNVLRRSLGLDIIPFVGARINVAVVDSGIQPTRDLIHNIDGFWDFTRGGIQTRPRDDYGHGTHVAGLIASTGVESDKQFAGVAPGARLYGFRVLDKKGRGRTSDVVSALEFIVANKLSPSADAFKIDVINLSLGHPVYEPAGSDPLVRAVESAVRAGIVVVAAAGNAGTDHRGDAGYTGIMSPGNAPSAITVGAAHTKHTASVADDTVASFSSRGPTWFDGFAKPDIVAPGVGLTSDAPRRSSLFQLFPHLHESSKRGSGSFGKLSGTSMATAVATGIAAVVLEANRAATPDGPALPPNALKAVLQYTAFRLKDSTGAFYDALTQGTGAINPRGAVVMALAIDPGVPAGSPWLRATPAPVTRIGGAPVPWSQALFWDDNIVWGTDALSFHSRQWDDNIVWGTTLTDPDNIVWGTAAEVDNIVWGTAATWAGDLVFRDRIIGLMDGENIVWGTVNGLTGDNIVWGTWNDDNIVWGTWDDENIVWGTFEEGENIVWGTWNMTGEDNIVWGTAARVGR
jgi:serine protease AprX